MSAYVGSYVHVALNSGDPDVKVHVMDSGYVRVRITDGDQSPVTLEFTGCGSTVEDWWHSVHRLIQECRDDHATDVRAAANDRLTDYGRLRPTGTDSSVPF